MAYNHILDNLPDYANAEPRIVHEWDKDLKQWITTFGGHKVFNDEKTSCETLKEGYKWGLGKLKEFREGPIKYQRILAEKNYQSQLKGLEQLQKDLSAEINVELDEHTFNAE
jgi:hypothetical protein